MNKKDTDLLVCAVGGLPPVLWLNWCHAPDQREHWNDVRVTYQGVYAELKTYFSGQPHPHTSAEPKVRRLYQLVSRRYIDLYNVIRDGWERIKETATKLDIQLGVKTPGECLVAIIEGDCAVTFSQCLMYSEYRPRYLHEMYRLKGKIGSLNVRGRKPTKKEDKEIAEFEKFKKQSHRVAQENREFWKLYLFCMEVCQESRDEDVRTSLKRYRVTNEELEQYLHSFMHPSQKQKGSKFDNGVRKPLS